MANITFTPIVPKHGMKTVDAGKVSQALKDLAYRAQARLMKYPPASTDYKRTGKLGRNWSVKGPEVVEDVLQITVGNNTEYAPYVQGGTSKEPKQVKWAAQYGWPSAQTVGDEEWKKAEPGIKAILGLKK